MTHEVVPVLVVGGYLGAGKTTMINQLLARATEPVAVIVNDFGSVNVDATLVRATHPDTIEFTNGCICCSPGTSLADTLFAILERPIRPITIVIEASGVADPSAVLAYAHIDGLRPGGIVVLVDAVNATATSLDTLVARTFHRQVGAADIVIVTKPDDPDADVANVMILVRSINTNAPVLLGAPDTLGDLVLVQHRGDASVIRKEHDAFAVETWDAHGYANVEAIRDTLAQVGPCLVRAKGIVVLDDDTRVLVQSVGSRVSVEPTDLEPTGLVVIRSVDPTR